MDEMARCISSSFATTLIERWERGEDIPHRTWYTRDGNVWVGIDNLDGCCWVEEFDTKEKVIEWLIG